MYRAPNMTADPSNYYGEAPLQATESVSNSRQIACATSHSTSNEPSSKQKGIEQIHDTLKEEAEALDDREAANFKGLIELKRRQMEAEIRESAVIQRERAVVETEKTVNKMLEVTL